MRRMLIAVLSGVVMALSLPLGAGADTTVTATMRDAIVGGGPALPGETIEYTVIISDTGNGEAALGVVFSVATLDSETTLVGSIIAFPIAVDDDYVLSATGNITTQITSANGLLANDVDPDGGGTTGACSDDPGTKCLVAEVSSGGTIGGPVTVFPATIDTNQDGEVIVQADGSFTYSAPAGFTGTDGFVYLVEDAGGNSDDATGTGTSTSIGTVSILVTEAVWYVDNSVGGANNGSLSDPFNTATALQDAAAASGTGDLIFVFEEGGGVYGGGIALQADQMLIGAGEGLTITFDDGGGAVNIIVEAAGGASPVITNSGGDGITLASAITSGNTIKGLDVGNGANPVNGDGIFGGSDLETVTISGVNITTSGGAAIDLTGDATDDVLAISLGSVTADGGAGDGISVTGFASGSFTVTGTTSVGATTPPGFDGISLISNGAATFTFADIDVTTASGDGLVASSSGTVNIDDGTPISTIGATGGAAVDITSTIIDVNFASVTASGGTNGIRLNSTSGTGFEVTGTSSITNSTGVGVSLTSNSANIDLGDLDIDNTTSNQNGLVATSNSGTLTTDDGTINTGSGTAVNITSTDISGTGVTFASVSASGGANGIVLTNTGSTGGSFTVTGTGTAGTGGTIQNTTGANGATSGIGIRLSNAQNVSLNFMQINGHTNFAIRGFDVTGFEMADSVVNGVNGNSAADDEASISFDDLLGNSVITRSTINGGLENNIRVLNDSSTAMTLTITDNTIGPNSTASGNDGIGVEAQLNADMTLIIAGNTLTAHRGDHIDITSLDDSTVDVVITDNVMTGGHPNPGGQSLVVASDEASDFTFDISENTINGAIVNAFTIFQGKPVASAVSTLTGTIHDNSIGTAGVNGSGSSQGNGIDVDATGRGTLTVDISDNDIRQWENFAGLLLQAGDDDPNLNVTVTGNTILNPNTGFNPINALHANIGKTAAGTVAACLDITGNNMVGGGSPTDFRLRQRNSSTVNLPGYAGSTNGSGVVAFIQGQNTGVPDGSFQVSGSGGGFTGNAGCTLPPIELITIIKGAGSGSVNVNPPNVTCSPPSTTDADCRQVFGSSTSVTLTATADGGSSFAGWGGVCAAEGTNATCTRTIDAARSATATFD